MKWSQLELALEDGSADWESDWVDCRGWAYVLFIVPWTTVAASAGVLSMQGRNVATNAVAERVVDFANADLQWWGDGFTVGATAGEALIAFESCPAQLRIKYTWAAGGGADQFLPTVIRQG